MIPPSWGRLVRLILPRGLCEKIKSVGGKRLSHRCSRIDRACLILVLDQKKITVVGRMIALVVRKCKCIGGLFDEESLVGELEWCGRSR